MVLCRFVDCVDGVSDATMVLRYCVLCAKRQQRAMCFSSSAAGHFFVGLLLQVVFLLLVVRGDHFIFAESDNHRPRLYDATSLGGPCLTIASVTYLRCVTADNCRCDWSPDQTVPLSLSRCSVRSRGGMRTQRCRRHGTQTGQRGSSGTGGASSLSWTLSTTTSSAAWRPSCTRRATPTM